ncbi:EamA-like transporter family protein [Anatilimnocola aggregata]|uniref:EamA-like transporter family protein n=1 Tax=Anatilimnocola aggregata TaxID=2528021 RepID=A0A517YDS3_9BACT|nr:EamA family transporter [Anatilimnocola aggregata]QDU28394.1 EamA-like transporter family protein [Anatilimnocola aggregata]
MLQTLRDKPLSFVPAMLTQTTSAERWRARLLVLIAALLWSSSGFFAKAPDFKGWPGPTIAFWRALFACVILLPMVRRPSWSWKMVPMTLIFAAMNYTYLTAMARGSAANAIWLQNTGPMIVLLVGVLVFKESSRGLDWLMAALSSAGIGLILYFESQGAAFDAVLYGLASGITYAGVVLSLRMLREHESAWLIALNHMVTACILAPFALPLLAPVYELEASVVEQYWPQGRQWLMLAAFGIFQMGLPYFLFARSLRTIPGHEASGIGLVEPLLVPVWVCLAWGWRENMPAWWTIAGGGLIFSGLVLRYLGTLRDQPELPVSNRPDANEAPANA